ncbi:MAG: circadian clock KaiB family protein [Hymenobacter sp.]
MLYVAGATPNSTRAVRNIKAICEEYLPGGYALRILDIYQRPELARWHGWWPMPTTLVRLRLLPQRRPSGRPLEPPRRVERFRIGPFAAPATAP